MAKYEFEPNAIFHQRDKADPNEIGNALEDIARNHDNRLRPEDVLNEARKRNHPLHRHFIWDNDKAAELYRIDQARALIRSVKIIAAEEVNQAAGRAYHSIQDNGRSYRSASEIKSSVSLQLSLYLAALRDLKAWEKRYRSIAHICELVGVAREELEQTITRMGEQRESQSRRPRPSEERPSP
jgi:hypothetical protein